MRKFLAILLLICVLSVASPAVAENWAQWRGPSLNGSTAETNLPEKLNPTENLLWSLPMPGRGSATPIVWEDRVFVSSLDKKTRKLVAFCIDRLSGKVLWQKAAGDGSMEKSNCDLASPSALADATGVYFYFGTGDLVKYDMEGKELWARNLQKDHGPFNYQWLYGSSPLLYKGRLYIQVLHRNLPSSNWGEPKPGDKLAESYLLAINPADGKDIWKQPRPNKAKAESQESYATPMPYDGPGRSEIVLIGGDCVTAHDPETGKEFWRRAGDWNPGFVPHWRMVPSVAIVNDLVIACVPKGGPVLAFKVGGEGGDTASHTAWKSNKFSSDVCVPLYYQGNLYVLDGDRKTISCINPADAQVRWSGKLESRPVFRGSPTAGDGKIYCMNEGGDTWVLSASEFKVLSQSSLGSDRARGSIALSHGIAFVHTADTLYAFGKKQ